MPSQPNTSQSLPLRSHPHLYEINTWTWLEQLSASVSKSITLAEVPDSEWDSLAAQGFHVVWLMGVWQRSPASRRMNVENPANAAQFSLALPNWKPDDVISSPYSVTAYVPDPRIGDWAGLDAAREKLRARGIALFLDFVGNHTALDHPWTSEHPEFYVQASPEEFQKNPSLYYTQSTAQGPQYIALAKDPYFPPWQDVAQLNHFNPALRAAQLQDERE